MSSVTTQSVVLAVARANKLSAADTQVLEENAETLRHSTSPGAFLESIRRDVDAKLFTAFTALADKFHPGCSLALEEEKQPAMRRVPYRRTATATI